MTFRLLLKFFESVYFEKKAKLLGMDDNLKESWKTIVSNQTLPYIRHVKLKSTCGPHIISIDHEIHHAGCI